MEIKDFKDGKLILLSKAFGSRAKVLNFISFIAYTFGGMIMTFLLLSTKANAVLLTLFLLIVIFIYGYVAYKFINKTLQRESIYVNKYYIEIVSGNGIIVKSNKYELIEVNNFRHLEKPELTSHPLANNTFDYMGFQTEQKMINELHGDKRLAFDYGNKTVTFGENVYIWQYEEIRLTISNFRLASLEV